jgi:hypothetical protein
VTGGRRIVAALAAALLAAAGAAAGCGTAGPEGAGRAGPDRPRSASAVRAALRSARALVSLDAARLRVRVELRPRRPGFEARYDAARRTATLFASSSTAPHRLAHALAHELGHAIDLDGLRPSDRRAYLARRGRPGAAWWAHEDASDYDVGAGDFAEVFALCHAASPLFRSRLAPRPTNPCSLLPAAASRMAARASKRGA